MQQTTTGSTTSGNNGQTERSDKRDALGSARRYLGKGLQNNGDRLSRSGAYLQDADLRRFGSDLTALMARHPRITMAVGFGLGIAIGRMLGRR